MTQRPVTSLRTAGISLVLATLVLAGCAGKVTYVRPTPYATAGANAVTIAKPRDAVWAAAVPELGKRFFVVNNLDKASGFINMSYSGDPARYVDCGRVTSYVKNARGERTYDFAGSAAQQTYEVMKPGQGLFLIDRRMALEGRVNLVFEEVSASQTRVSANTRYVVNRQQNVRDFGTNQSQNFNDSISFNTGTSATFAGNTDQATECTSTGALEQEILSAFR